MEYVMYLDGVMVVERALAEILWAAGHMGLFEDVLKTYRWCFCF